MFCCGMAIKLPKMTVTVAIPATAGTHFIIAGPAPSTKSRMMTMNPAAFGATDSHATNGVPAASYVSGTHMWNGTAAILNPSPASVSTRPRSSSGFAASNAGPMAEIAVTPVTPYTNDNPYRSTAEDTLPTTKNFSAPSGADSLRFSKPVRKYSGIDMSSNETNNSTKSRADASTTIPSSDASKA